MSNVDFFWHTEPIMFDQEDKFAQKASPVTHTFGYPLMMLRNDLTKIIQHKVMNLFNFRQFYTIIVIFL